MPVPSLGDLLPAGSVVTGVVPRTGGTRGTVHEIRRAGAEPLIVKRYADEWRWAQAKEAPVYAVLAEHDVGPAPRVVRADLERGVTVLTLVPGAPLAEAGLAPAAMGAAYRRMGGLLAALHRIAMPAFGYLTTGLADPRPDNAGFVREQFGRHLATFAARGGPAGLRDAIRSHLAARGGLLEACDGAVLCHNDFHEGNVLVDEAGAVTGFVDVENAIAADPLLDLAKTLQYDAERSPEKRAALLAGYGPLPPDADARLFHSLELRAYFASTGNTGPLPSIADDMRELTG